MSKDVSWTTILSVAGAAGAAVALVYLVGGMVMSMRYDAFGLTGQQAIAYTPREVLLVAGVRSLTLWAILGVLAGLAVGRLPDRVGYGAVGWLYRPSGLAVLAVVVVALLFLLDVWWPLAALGALLVVVTTTVRWRNHPTRRFLVSAAVIAVVAAAYESDRISYLIDWTCVEVSGGSGLKDGSAQFGLHPLGRGSLRACGVLIGQDDHGYYIGSQGTWRNPQPGGPRYRLLFIPEDRVLTAYAQKESLRAIDARVDDRRKPLRLRLWDIRVR